MWHLESWANEACPHATSDLYRNIGIFIYNKWHHVILFVYPHSSLLFQLLFFFWVKFHYFLPLLLNKPSLFNLKFLLCLKLHKNHRHLFFSVPRKYLHLCINFFSLLLSFLINECYHVINLGGKVSLLFIVESWNIRLCHRYYTVKLLNRETDELPTYLLSNILFTETHNVKFCHRRRSGNLYNIRICICDKSNW